MISVLGVGRQGFEIAVLTMFQKREEKINRTDENGELRRELEPLMRQIRQSF